jgi:GntR family transcriptional repressor for pyruvate dehydrogenase complex
LGKYSHNSIVENIYSFVIELFAPTLNPVHGGVIEAHTDLHRAIMERDPDRALVAVQRHTAIWVESHREQVEGVVAT